MKLLLGGASGLIGTALADSFGTGEVWRLVRSTPRPGEMAIEWHPDQGRLDPARLEGFDAVIHLGGESIAGRWNEAKKARLYSSRIESTQLLAKALTCLERKPRVFLCASAIGIYGNRGDEVLTETSEHGAGFMADICRDWEAATAPATEAGIRVVNLRFGIVMSMQGGALKGMITPFKLGLGGPLGNGKQYWSWVSLPDAVGAIRYALLHDDLSGPVNIVAPEPVRNNKFTKTLGKVLKRPTIFRVPGFVLRLILGEMADAAILASERVEPARLQESGFTFRHPTLESMLCAELK